MCILSGFPWHTALSQMDNLQNCLDSLSLDLTTEILLAVEGLLGISLTVGIGLTA